jgi:hypothetical protein
VEAGAGVVVVGAAAFVLVVDAVDEDEAAAAVVVGVLIAPPPTVGPQALRSSAPAASAVITPAPDLIRAPCAVRSAAREPSQCRGDVPADGCRQLLGALDVVQVRRPEAGHEGSSPYASPAWPCGSRDCLEQIVIKA